MQIYVLNILTLYPIILLLVLRQGNFRQNFTRKFPETIGTKV